MGAFGANLRHYLTLVAIAVGTLILSSARPAAAGTELSFYGGMQDAFDSRVHGTDPGGVGAFDFTADWSGKSLRNPPYFGVRATWWRDERLGFGVEYTHSKIYADDATKLSSGFTRLEFTDGLNIITANVLYRWPDPDRRWTPYVGVGLGIAVPHVEVTSAGGSVFEYQYGGPAATAMAGVSYHLSDRWSAFGEYKLTYSVNDVDLGSGGDLHTNVLTSAFNFGVSWSF